MRTLPAVVLSLAMLRAGCVTVPPGTGVTFPVGGNPPTGEASIRRVESPKAGTQLGYRKFNGALTNAFYKVDILENEVIWTVYDEALGAEASSK